MLLILSLLSFILGIALLLISALLMTFDIFWDIGEIIFKISGILILGPIVIALLVGAFALLISLFGFTLLF